MGIGKEIRRARAEKGYSQDELARLVGVANGATVSGWERGRIPRAESIRKLNNILDINLWGIKPSTMSWGLATFKAFEEVSFQVVELLQNMHISSEIEKEYIFTKKKRGFGEYMFFEYGKDELVLEESTLTTEQAHNIRR